jgi:16S rRNA (guanine527-N7)-methyltransferase
MSEPLLERWLEEVVATPGVTGLTTVGDARRMLLEDAVRAAPLVEATAGAVVDVGSGGGSPGIPLAAARPELEFHLLESVRKKCDFLTEITADFANVEVVCARAEEHAAGAGRDFDGTALTRALAPPPVAAEWCLPLVAVGGRAVLFVGPSADAEAVGRVAAKLGAHDPELAGGFLVLRKTQPTPAGFPRRPGLARKRPLA